MKIVNAVQVNILHMPAEERLQIILVMSASVQAQG